MECVLLARVIAIGSAVGVVISRKKSTPAPNLAHNSAPIVALTDAPTPLALLPGIPPDLAPDPVVSPVEPSPAPTCAPSSAPTPEDCLGSGEY